MRVKKPYMITSKGVGGDNWPALRLSPIAPYFALIAFSLAASWFYLAVHGHGSSQGYLLFSVQGAALFWLLIGVILFQDRRMLAHFGASAIDWLHTRWTVTLAFMATSLLLFATIVLSSTRIVEAVI
jgi:hypothetical protein